ncbi:MAG: DMT family transporter [Theionarchaea archaeon]|nr:DMT family transporter [Theionarchaea archaeon]
MNRGYFLAAVAGVSWGTIPIAVKQIYSLGSASALEISFFRFVIALLIIGLITKMRAQSLILKNKWSVLMGFWGIFWMSTISFYGIQYTSAVNATILFNANPLFVAALVIVLKWEKITSLTITGIFLGIAGVILVSGVSVRLHVIGDVLVLLGAFGWAVYTILGYKLRTVSSLSVTASSLFWGLLFFCGFIWREPLPASGAAWMWILYIGIVPTAVAFVFYIKAVDVIGSTKASVFQYLAPAVAVILSVGFGLETVSLSQVVGIVLIVAGIELTRRSETLS